LIGVLFLILIAVPQSPSLDASSLITWNATQRSSDALPWQAYTLLSVGAEAEARGVIRELLKADSADPDALRFQLELDAPYPHKQELVLRDAESWLSRFQASEPVASVESVSKLISFLRQEVARRDSIADKSALLWQGPLAGFFFLLALFMSARRFLT